MAETASFKQPEDKHIIVQKTGGCMQQISVVPDHFTWFIVVFRVVKPCSLVLPPSSATRPFKHEDGGNTSSETLVRTYTASQPRRQTTFDEFIAERLQIPNFTWFFEKFLNCFGKFH
jgi:hypothetical protein